MAWNSLEEKHEFEVRHYENILGIAPYTIDDGGHFKSTKLYPHFFKECINNEVPMIGDCLLRLFTHSGKFRCTIGDFVMDAEPITSYTSGGYEINLFESGLPTKVCSAPILETDDPETMVYAMYEQYGVNNSNQLIRYRHHKNPNHSVKLRHKNGKTYVIHNMHHKGTHLNTLKNDT